MKNLFVFLLLVCLVGVVSADTMLIYTTNATDGHLNRFVQNSTFEEIRNGVGNGASIVASFGDSYVRSSLNAGCFTSIYRFVYIPDTSILPDTASISSAIAGITPRSISQTPLGYSNLSITKFNITAI